MSPAVVTAAVLVIGDEILSGRTKDKNIGTIATRLTAIGVRLCEVRVVPDEEAAIVSALNALRTRYDYVFTTGGIGPTHDDITADCVAKAFGVEIGLDPRAVALMQPAYEKRGIEFNDARKRMARIPAGADLITNSVSMAPGFRLENVIVMAGVPAIMEAMLTVATATLKTGVPVASLTIAVAHAEGEIAAMFGDHQRAWPHVSMGSYPQMKDGRYTTELVLRSTDPGELHQAAEQLCAKLATSGYTFTPPVNILPPPATLS